MSKLIFVAAGEEANWGYMESVKYLGLEVTDSVRDFHAFPEEFALVVFTGGADVTPSIYGHERSKLTYNNEMRDYHEKHIFMTALEFGIPMSGICRGMQWLNCMAGGFMVQHLDGHNLAGNHYAHRYDGEDIKVNSLHHQMCVPPEDAYVLAASATQRSGRYILGNKKKKFTAPVEVESAYFPNIHAFGVQWHPEGYGCPKEAVAFWEEHVDLLFDHGEFRHIMETRNPPTMPQLFEDHVMSRKYGLRYNFVREQNQHKAEEAT